LPLIIVGGAPPEVVRKQLPGRRRYLKIEGL